MILFDPFFRFDETLRTNGHRTFVPAADVTVSDHDVVLTFDLPGMTADDLELQFREGDLVIRGERRRPDFGNGTTRTHAERPWGAFERRVRLPEGVDPDAVTASMDNGVLSLIVPKPDRLKPRTIRIGSGSAEQQQLASTT